MIASQAALGILLVFQVMTPADAQPKVRMCYVTNWSQRRPDIGRFTPSDIDPVLCSHIIYAFAHISVDRTAVVTTEQEDQGFFEQLMGLKRKNPNLKVILSVGGADADQAQRFDDVASVPVLTTVFTSNVIRFLRLHGFDGLDIGWEFPNANNRVALRLLVARLWLNFAEEARVMNRETLLLTMAVWGNHEEASNSYDPLSLTKYVDYFLLMTYNLWGTWSPELGHHAALRARPQDANDGNLTRFTVDKTVQEWIRQGVPRSKLVLGFAMYGLTTKLTNSAWHDMGDSYTQLKGTAGRLTKEAGVLSYSEICENLADVQKGWTSFYEPVTEGAFAYSTQSLDWACYDSPLSFREKAAYLVREQLAGAFVWSLDHDDFTGRACGNGTYPLLREVYRALADLSSPYTPRPPVVTSPTVPATTTTTTSPYTPRPPVVTSPTTSTTTTTTTSPVTATTPTATTSTTVITTVTTVKATAAVSIPSTSTITTTDKQIPSSSPKPATTTTTATTVSLSKPTILTRSPASRTTTTTGRPTVVNVFTTSMISTARPTTTSTTDTPTSSRPTSATSTSECSPFRCPATASPSTASPSNPNDLYPDPFSCTQYYQCSRSRVFLFRCAASLFFNPLTLQCDWPTVVNCVPCPVV